jgi:hypothetical protein
MDLFPSSDETLILFGPLERVNLNHCALKFWVLY